MSKLSKAIRIRRAERSQVITKETNLMIDMEAINTMTYRQADKLIASGKLVTLYHPKFQETFTAVVTSRNRFSIYFKYGDDSGRCGLVARDEVKIVEAQI